MSSKSRRTIPLTLTVFILLLLSAPSLAKTIYVDDDAVGANDGTNWSDAYIHLQDALVDANSADKPVEINIAQGTYTPDSNSAVPDGTHNRNATFQLINNVILKGGFAGIVGVDPDVRNVEAYRTILSGDLNGDDLEVVNYPEYVQPTRAENSHHVVMSNSVDKTAVLDGLVIIGGTDGGMHNSQSNPTLFNCTFSGNLGHPNGGGMYNFQSSPTLTDCTFSENHAYDGGGMYNAGSSPTLTNCIFYGNRAGWGGGGMYNVYNVYDGQGMTFGSQSNPVLTKCIFSKNSADEGGGMYNRGGPYHSSPTLIRCTFSGNWTEGEGGGINNFQSDPVLMHCTFSGNLAFRLGAGMYNQRRSSPTLTNCTFSGNSTNDSGGGMYNSQSTPALINCTFAQNSARNGNALACDSSGQNDPSTIELINCILWDSRSEMWGLDNPGDEIWNNDNSMITMTYSNIKGGFPGEGNMDADPLFTDLGYFDDFGIAYEISDDHWVDGDYHLKSQAGRWDPNSQSWVVDDVTSPCIDAGDPNSDWTSETWPHGGGINMGAYGGTPEASMSTRPEAMALPRVAYIHKHNVEAAESFQSLLSSYGCPTSLLGLEEVAAAPLDSYDLIIVGTDTGFTSDWADAQSVAAIETSVKPVVGLGEGGYAFFGKLGLPIGYPNGAHGSRNSISVMDPNNPLFSTPYTIDIPQDGILQVYTETANVGLYLWPVPETVTALGVEVDNPGYYPLALENERYFLWGFARSPETMTEVGKRLFINVVIRAANVAWESEI